MRRFADAVHVRSGVVRGAAHVPAQFLWRGRLYVVHDVLARWRERGDWWEHPSIAALHGEGDGPPAQVPPGHLPAWAEGVEREVWRVEASAGRAGAAGVYDLCRPAMPGTVSAPAPLDDDAWRLLRVSD